MDYIGQAGESPHPLTLTSSAYVDRHEFNNAGFFDKGHIDRPAD